MIWNHSAQKLQVEKSSNTYSVWHKNLLRLYHVVLYVFYSKICVYTQVHRLVLMVGSFVRTMDILLNFYYLPESMMAFVVSYSALRFYNHYAASQVN